MLNTESVLHVLELYHLARSSLPVTLIFKYSIHPHTSGPLTDNDHFCASQSFFFFVSHRCRLYLRWCDHLRNRREWEDSLWC